MESTFSDARDVDGTSVAHAVLEHQSRQKLENRSLQFQKDLQEQRINFLKQEEIRAQLREAKAKAREAIKRRKDKLPQFSD